MHPWWGVTFKHLVRVKEVTIVNRADCCGKWRGGVIVTEVITTTTGSSCWYLDAWYKRVGRFLHDQHHILGEYLIVRKTWLECPQANCFADALLRRHINMHPFCENESQLISNWESFKDEISHLLLLTYNWCSDAVLKFVFAATVRREYVSHVEWYFIIFTVFPCLKKLDAFNCNSIVIVNIIFNDILVLL